MQNNYRRELQTLVQLNSFQMAVNLMPFDKKLSDFIHKSLSQIDEVIACRVCLLVAGEPVGGKPNEKCRGCKFFNTGNSEIHDKCLLFNVQDIVVVPIKTVHQVYGYISLKLKPNCSKNILSALNNFAAYVAVSIENVRQNQILEEQNASLRILKDDLEVKIKERTRELQISKESAEENEKLYHSVFNSKTNIVFVYNLEGKFLDANEAALNLLGYEHEIIRDINIKDLVSVENVQLVFGEVQKLLNGEEVGLIEIELFTKAGNKAWVETNKTLLYKKNKPYAILGVARDITDQVITKQKLKESNDLLTNLAAQVPGVVYQYRLYPDGSSAFPYSSPGMYEIYEVNSEEVREDASSVFTRIHPDDYDYIVDTINESARNQTVYASEFRVILPEQGLRWRYCHAKPELLDDGSTLWHGIITDITERKEAEQALKDSEEFYRKYYEYAPYGILFSEPYTLGNPNPRAMEMFGYSQQEMARLSPNDLSPSFQPDGSSSNEKSAYYLREVMSGNPQNFEWVHLRKDGSLFYTQVNLIPVKFNQKTRILAFIEDIDAQKLAEKQIKSQKQRLINIVESSNLGTWEWNVQTGETIFNENWAKIIGYSLEEISPTNIDTWYRFVHPDDVEKSKNQLERHFKGELDYYHFECRMKHKQGHWIWVLDRGKIISRTDDGKPLWIFGTHQNISERVKATKALQESENRYRSLIEQASEMFYLHDIQGNIVEVNRAAERHMGYTRKDLLNLTVKDLDPEASRFDYFEKYWKKLKVSDPTLNVETKHRRKDGSIFPIEISLSKVRIANSEYIFALARDITERKRQQKEYKELINGMNESIYVCDYEGRFIDVNRSAIEMLGYTKEELLRMGPADIDPDKDPEKVIAIIEEIVNTDNHVFETRHQAKTGKVIPVEISSSPVSYLGKKVILNVVRDVSERKRSEEAIFENMQKYQALFNQSADGIYLHDLQGEILDVNEAAIIQTGFSRNELLRMNVFRLSRNEARKNKIIEEWENWPLGNSYKIEDFHIRKGGSVFPVEINTGKVHFGKKERMLAMTRDITERKMAEESITKNTLRLESLLQASQMLASTLEMETLLQRSVEKAAGLLDFSSGAIYIVEEENLILKATHPKLPDDYPEIYRKARYSDHMHIRKAIETQEVVYVKDAREEKFTDAERQIAESMGLKSILYIPIPVRIKFKGVFILSTLDDIKIFSEEEVDLYRTFANQVALALESSYLYSSVKDQANKLEKRVYERTAELEEANKEMEAFTYSVSHDLRAPLRAINGFSQYLNQDYADKLDEEGQRYLQIIRDNTRKMDQLITDLLKLSRLSRAELDFIDLDMASIARSMFFEVATEKEKEEFEFLLEDIPDARGDITSIKQVWTNLIDNALKYSSTSKKKKIIVGYCGDEKMHIYYVKDFGKGFDPRYKDKLFGIFQRLHKESQFRGTGVGLAIVKRIMDKHNGKIWAEGEPDKGATFYFSLPK